MVRWRSDPRFLTSCGNAGRIFEYMNRALDLAERGRGRPAPTRWSARWSCARTARSSGRDITSRREVRTQKCARSTKPAISRAARRCTARSSRAATSAEPARASSAWRQPASRAWSRRTVDADPRVSGRGFELLRQKGIEVSVGAGPGARAPAEPRLFHVQDEASAVRHHESGDEPRQPRGGEGRDERTRISSDDSLRHAHAVRAEVDAIARGIGDGARRRSAADRARGASPPSADARAVRSPAADPPVGPGVLDARRGTGNNRHHAREH